MGKKHEQSNLSREEIEAQRQEELRIELEKLEQRFAAELEALEKFEPIKVSLEGSKNLHSILKSIEDRFLGQGLNSFFDISWSLSEEQVVITSNFGRRPRNSVLNVLANYHEGLNEWLATPNKGNSLRTFIQIKVENESLKSRVQELESKLERNRDEGPRWPYPMMMRGGPFGMW